VRIGIVGAGVTGLVAGYELAKAGHTVVLFESDANIGGLTRVEKVGGQSLERFYHHIFTGDTEMVALLSELGLSHHLRWKSPQSATYLNRVIYPFSSPMDLLRFKELPILQRLALGLLVYRSRFITSWESLEAISAREWIVKNVGQRAYDVYWSPLLRAKFDDDAELISAAWLWNKFKLRGSTRTSHSGRECFGYLEGSFAVLYQALAAAIRSMGGQIICSAAVTALWQSDENGVLLETEAGQYAFDRVIATTSPAIFASYCKNMPDTYAKQLKQIRYKANLCVVLELNCSLSPYYWITLAEKDFPFVAVVEHTQLVSSGTYGGHIIYLSRYLDATNPLYSASDEDIEALALTSLGQVFHSFDPTLVKSCTVHRAQYAQPVVVQNYSRLIPNMKTPIPGIYLACMAQIHPEDRGQNYGIRLGRKVATLVEAGGEEQC